MDGSTVAMVTGANGHVGRNLVTALLERGYRVRATVRDAGDARKTEGLTGPGLEFVSLDVRDARKFEEAAEGVDLLFHAAATYKNYTSGRQEAEEMLRDALDGTRAALNAAARQRVRRLVYTSSVVTVPVVERGGRATTEEDWRTDFTMPYHRAKTLAEQEAWRLAREFGVDMVAVLPGAILGPGFTRSTASTDIIESIMLGGMKMGAPDANFPAVDVRDVVSGHLLAAETPSAKGRYILCNDVLPKFIDIARTMHAIDPSVPLPPRVMPDAAMALGPFFDWINHRMLGAPRTIGREVIAALRGKEWTMSNARARGELGWQQAITLERSLADTMARLRALRAKKPAGAEPVPA